MVQTVLVAYATKYGSTKEVAEAVASAVRDEGLEAVVQLMKATANVDAYAAVVIGAPLYIGSWLKDADRFLAQHREALSRRPVAVFALGPTGSAADDAKGAREQLDKQIAKVPWLKPATVELFGGRLDVAHLRFPDSLLAKLPASPLYKAPSSDARDWGAIRGWASRFAASLKPASRA